MKDDEIVVVGEEDAQTASGGLRHPKQEKAEMDIVLAIKHLLALEDHLREFSPVNEEEESWRINTLRGVEIIRSGLFDMFEEKDKRFHCMSKHILGAVMALDEVDKVYSEDSKYPQAEDITMYADNARLVSIDILEHLLGHEIENCKRCK